VIDPETVQHINLKIFVEDESAFILSDAVVVFHRWIRESACPEMLIDVADYAHVSAGPGLLLIGHEANYSFDNRENRLGLLYNRKASLNGNFRSRLEQAHRAALEACERLEREPEFGGKLKFNRDTMEVFVNDRLLGCAAAGAGRAVRWLYDSAHRRTAGSVPGFGYQGVVATSRRNYETASSRSRLGNVCR
jgi:hypothetical protein